MTTLKRKRGIKASREKLELAMARKGFKTQRELAQKIAADEGISLPPKDLVSKVFREQAVSFQNLARIANALDIDAHTIYLSKNDQPVDEILTTQVTAKTPVTEGNESNNACDNEETAFTAKLDSQPTNQPDECAKRQIVKQFSPLTSLIFAIVIASVFSVYFSFKNDAIQAPELPVTSTKINSSLGKVLIVVQTDTETQALAQTLAASFNNIAGISVIVLETPASYQLSAHEAMRKWQSHAVLRFSLKQGQYYQYLSVTMSSKSHQAQLAQWYLRSSELKSSEAIILESAKQQVVKFVAGNKLASVYSHSELAHEHYLTGVNQLYLSHSIDSYRQATQSFELAIVEDESFALPYAQLCLIKVRESWMASEVSSLERAAYFCQEAERIAPDDINTAIAKTELLARTGELEQALLLRNRLPNPLIDNADAYATFAELALVASNKLELESADQDITAAAERALILAPDHWRALNTLSNYYFAQGSIVYAKRYLEQAAHVAKHKLLLANLGTMQLCLDELEPAASTYKTILNIAKDDYLAHENLGTVYLMQHKYQKALAEKRIAIELQPDIAIHQVWSGLAQTYFWAGQPEQAFQYYSDALSVLERDELLGNANINDQLHKLYYKVKLNELVPEPAQAAEFEIELKYFIKKSQDLGIKERSHLAWLANKFGYRDVSASLINDISAICPVYLRSPELQSL